jgi:hypothetical protein
LTCCLFKGLLGSFPRGSFYFWVFFRARCLAQRRRWRCRFLNWLTGAFRGWEPSILQLVEAEEGTGDLTVESNLVAEEEFVGADAVGGSAQRQDGKEGIHGGGGARFNVVVKSDFLHSQDSTLPQVSGGCGFHQHGFSRRARLAFFLEIVQELEEAAAVLGFEDDGFRERTVTGTVARGVEFARGRGGAV